MAYYINNDSARYVQSSNYKQKKGSRADGTDAAHKLSWELINAVGTHTGGRPLGDYGRGNLERDMNSRDNLRIKSMRGNRVLDRRRDDRIAEAIVGGSGMLMERTTAHRAHQAYLGAMGSGNASMMGVGEKIGNLALYTGKPGRPKLVRNM